MKKGRGGQLPSIVFIFSMCASRGSVSAQHPCARRLSQHSMVAHHAQLAHVAVSVTSSSMSHLRVHLLLLCLPYQLFSQRADAGGRRRTSCLCLLHTDRLSLLGVRGGGQGRVELELELGPLYALMLLDLAYLTGAGR